MNKLPAAVRLLLPALAGGLSLACVATERGAPTASAERRAQLGSAPDLPRVEGRSDSELLRAVLRAAHAPDGLATRPAANGVGPVDFEPGSYGRAHHGVPTPTTLAASAGDGSDRALRGRALPVASRRPLSLDEIVLAMEDDVPLAQALLLTTREVHLERRAADGRGWESIATWHNQPGVSLPRGLDEFARMLEWLSSDRGLRVEHARPDGMHRSFSAAPRAVLRIDASPTRVPLRLWPDNVELDRVPLGQGLEASILFGDDERADGPVPFRFRLVPRSERQVLDFLGSLSRNQISAADLRGPTAATDYVPWFSVDGSRRAAFRLRSAPPRAAGPSVVAVHDGREFHVAGRAAPADRTLDSLRFVESLLAREAAAGVADALAAR